MAKKLLSEAQVRKFMGLANLDANLSSNFLKEMYGEPAKRDEEEMEEGMYKMKRDDEMKEEKHDDKERVMKEEEIVNEEEEKANEREKKKTVNKFMILLESMTGFHIYIFSILFL